MLNVMVRQLCCALAVLASLTLALPQPARASEIGKAAIRFDDALLANRPAFAFGWEFQLTEAVTLAALGIYDPDGDGLGSRFEAGLYDSLGRLLAQTAIEGSGDAIRDAFTWRRIPRLELPAGVYTVAAAGVWAGGDQVPFNAERVRTASGVIYVRPRFRSGVTTLALPLEAFPAGISVQGYWAANFALADGNGASSDDDDPAGDPPARSTPAPLALLGLGEAMRRARMLRRRSGHRHLQARGFQHHLGAGAQAPALEAEVGSPAAALGDQGLELDREARR